jgi:DNA-binding NtrC family response regulator
LEKRFVLVSLNAGVVDVAIVENTPRGVPWRPEVRVHATSQGVRVGAESSAAGAGLLVPPGTVAFIGGRTTSCLPAVLASDGTVDVAFGRRMIGSSLAMLRVFHLAIAISFEPDPVAFLGESGTGKDLLARGIHETGQRSRAPFVAVNMAALPLDLVESELFGRARGAYTGAHDARPGAFEAASGGTLFLDEIAEAPPNVQAKLLRAVESGTVARLGSVAEVPVRARIMAATNQEPADAIRRGTLRLDLLERLACLVIRIPPLRERSGEIPSLARHLLGSGPGPIVESRGLATLMDHQWPGNVRELRNVLHRARLLAGNGPLGHGVIEESIGLGRVASPDFEFTCVSGPRGVRRSQIERSGLPRSTFYYRLKRGRIPVHALAEGTLRWGQ